MVQYHLAHQNMQEIGEMVFGDDIRKLGLQYNKKFRFWYRLLESDVIQFIGFKQYSGGFYATNIAAQPLYVPLLEVAWNLLKKGEVPCHDCYSDVNTDFGRLEMLKMIDARYVPSLGGTITDPLDKIIEHMRLTYTLIAKPILYNATDEVSCLSWYRRVKTIWIEMAKTSLGLEKAEIERRKINLMEAMILGATGRFREAALALAGPASRTASRYSKYLSDFANNDEEGFKNTMRLCRERNIEILKANKLL